MADIQETEVREIMGKGETRSGQAYLLGEVEAGPVRLGLGPALAEEGWP